ASVFPHSAPAQNYPDTHCTRGTTMFSCSRARRHPFRWLLPALLVALLLLGLAPAHAEQERVTTANYKQALKYSSNYLRQFGYDTAVVPTWIGKTDSFWYSFRTSQGTNYYRVDPKQGTKRPLFDRVKLATHLSELTQKPADPTQLPLTRVS